MKRILIIGATSAIATACARTWASQNCTLFLVARDPEKLAQHAADLSARGAASVTTHTMDATNLGAHNNMIECARATLSTFDIVLIAHGTLSDQFACEKSSATAIAEFNTNAVSVIALLTALAPIFEQQRNGTLAVISSVAGDRGRPSNYYYGAAKGAVSICCQGLRARLYKVGATVLTIKPGFVDTPMTRHLNLPARLLATPEGVARSILRAIDKRKSVLYTPYWWAYIMLIIKLIPEPIFKRLNL